MLFGTKLTLLLFFLIACKGQEKAPTRVAPSSPPPRAIIEVQPPKNVESLDKPGENEIAPPLKVAKDASSRAPLAPRVAGVDDALRCSEPFLNLAYESYDELVENTWFGDTKGLCSTCNKNSKSACRAKKLSCNSYDEARNSIYAAYGHDFQSAQWKAHFEAKPWYRSRGDGMPTTLPQIASLNVAILKWEALDCSAKLLESSDKTVISWDLDGDGEKEKVSVTDTHLEVGSVSIAHLGEGNVPEWTVVDLTPKDSSRQILLRVYDDEDSYQFQVVGFYKGVLKASEGEVYGNRPQLSSKGTLLFKSMNCGQRYWEELEWRKGELVWLNRKSIGRLDNDQCIACPFVYLDDGHNQVLVGEILRNLRGPGLEASQSLALGVSTSSNYSSIILREKKEEVTYIDALWLAGKAGVLKPTACLAASPPAYCNADDKYFVLNKGEALTIEFGTLLSDESFKLWAEGYYLPWSN